MTNNSGRVERGWLKQTWKMAKKADFLIQDHNFSFSVCRLHPEHLILFIQHWLSYQENFK